GKPSQAPPSQRVGFKRPHHDPAWVRRSLTLLAVGVLTVLVIVPVVNVYYQALAGGIGTYWDNLVADRDTRHAIALTLAVAPVAVFLNVLFGLAAAWLLARFRFPGRTLLLALIDVPFAVSPVVAGLMCVLVFGANGCLGPWLQLLGVRIIFAVPG